MSDGSRFLRRTGSGSGDYTSRASDQLGAGEALAPGDLERITERSRQATNERRRAAIDAHAAELKRELDWVRSREKFLGKQLLRNAKQRKRLDGR